MTDDTIKHAAKLPFGYAVEFTWTRDGGMKVEWTPTVPTIRSERAFKRFFAAYVAARATFLRQVADVVGGAVAVADVGGDDTPVSVVRPSTRH